MARPDSAELALAVRDFLKGELLPALDDNVLGYKGRVAVNVLGILAREAQQGEALRALEKRELAAFLGLEGDNTTLQTELVRRIGEGEVTANSPGLLDALEAISLAKIAIDNPRYRAAGSHLDKD